jgi:shikimate 5-dehydrogenase
MTLYQAMAQFELYTGNKAPAKVMQTAIERIVNA